MSVMKKHKLSDITTEESGIVLGILEKHKQTLNKGNEGGFCNLQ
jgi:hypothetical protein